MGVVRHVVLPVLRLLVWTVIAVALCVLAFGRGDAAEQAGPLSPLAGSGGATVAAETGDLTSTIEVTGTVSEDPGATVKATAAGVVGRVHVTVGQQVAAGAPLVEVLVPLEPLPGAETVAPDGTVTSTPAKPRTKKVSVTAPSAGTVASVAVLKDQDVSVGTDLAVVSPGTLSVTAPLTQAQQFRLLTPPASARAQAPGGPAPFDCTDLRTGAAAPATNQQPVYDPYSGMPQEAPSAQVTCRVPAGTTVFAGMSVDLAVEAGSVTGAVLVPVSAVLGTVGTGSVWVVSEDGEPSERAVTLGLTDGRSVQVTEGLTAGETVLQFTPVPLDDPDGPMGEEAFG